MCIRRSACQEYVEHQAQSTKSAISIFLLRPERSCKSMIVRRLLFDCHRSRLYVFDRATATHGYDAAVRVLEKGSDIVPQYPSGRK